MTTPLIPFVRLEIPLEGTPRIVVDAASNADREALGAWMRLCRPDIDLVLATVNREINDKAEAA